MSGENDLTAAFLKEFSKVDNTDIDPEAVEFNEDALRIWLRVKEACEYFNIDFEKVREQNTKIQMIESRARNLGVNQAIQDDDITRMSAIKGVDGDDAVDVAEWNQYEQIKDLFREEPLVSDFSNSVFQCFLFSSNVPPTGRGKSSTMYFLSEVAKTVHPDIRILSNVPSDPFETLSVYWDDIESEIKSYDGRMLILLDEVAQFLQYADQGAGKTVSQLLKLLRHNQTHLIGVAHTGADIPKDIRRQVFVLDKSSEKKGVLGYGIEPQKSGDLMQVAIEQIKLKAIPHTNINYEEEGAEPIDIQFDGNGEEEKSDEEIIEELKENTCAECSNPTYKHFEYCHAHLRKAVAEGEYEDVDLESKVEPEESSSNECRVCSRTVGIDSDGFCPDHDEDDLK